MKKAKKTPDFLNGLRIALDLDVLLSLFFILSQKHKLT